MDEAVSRRLVDINRAFYQSFAAPFARTRERIQPGVESLLETLPSSASILDIGCGSAAVLDRLARRGFQGRYTGLDFSSGLLAVASARLTPFPVDFFLSDLYGEDWDRPVRGRRFDAIFLFAVLHHLPAESRRAGLLRSVRSLLAPSGSLMMSNWRFQRSRRLASRVLPWESAGIQESELEAGDFLLDWRQGGAGRRYVHDLPEEERLRLACLSGYLEADRFESDGEGGQLSDYCVWRPANPAAASGNPQ